MRVECAEASYSLGFAITVSWLGFTSGHATELSSFQGGDGGWQLGTLAVGNLDNSGQLSIVVPYWNISPANGSSMPSNPTARACQGFRITETAKSTSHPRSTTLTAMVATKLFSPAAQTSLPCMAMARWSGPIR